jgi:hypothetical protein
MPFQRRNEWLYSFEREANKGKEFIMPITANRACNHWTRILGAITKREASGTTPKREGGVLVVRFHGKPLGILGAPEILRAILLDWNGNQYIQSDALAAISAELALLADSTKPVPPQPFRPRSLGVRARPSSVAALFRELEVDGGAVAILRYHKIYTFLIPLSLLMRFRLEAKQQSAQEWRESILNWMFQIDWLL